MTKIYLWSKKLHRILAIVITFMTLLMAGTGLLLKYNSWANKLSFLDLGMIRYIHNNLSVLFIVALGFMILTGIAMYLYPWWVQYKNKKSISSTDITK